MITIENIEPLEIKIKYHADIPHLEELAIGDWIDLRAAERVCMERGDFREISLGVSMQLPEGYEAQIRPRSSTYKTWCITMANSVGVIDESYCGDNDIWTFPARADRLTIIEKGDRICQFRIMKHQPPVKFVEVESLGNPDRGGLGSTGRS